MPFFQLSWEGCVWHRYCCTKVWEWGDAVIDVLDEIYCKSFITIALIINAHPGLMFTHSLSISSILQPFPWLRSDVRQALIPHSGFYCPLGRGLWMTPVLGSGSSTVMVPRHTELAIKLRGGSSQPCPLIHDFLFPCCHTQTLLPSWLLFQSIWWNVLLSLSSFPNSTAPLSGQGLNRAGPKGFCSPCLSSQTPCRSWGTLPWAQHILPARHRIDFPLSRAILWWLWGQFHLGSCSTVDDHGNVS